MAPSLARNMLRACVLKTNAYWPFGQCSRAAYSAAIKAFLIAVRNRKEISEIYLRNGMAGTDWVPGLSDIDLTVVMRSGLSEQEEYDFLVSFWEAYGILRKCFPMLGEVEILDETAVSTCLTHSSFSPDDRNWVLLRGRGDVNLAFDGCSGWQRRAVDMAIWIYLDVFVPCFRLPDWFVNRLDLRRRAAKIQRLLQPVLAGWEDTKSLACSNEPVDLMVEVLETLQTAVKQASTDAVQAPLNLSSRMAHPNLNDEFPALSCAKVIHSIVTMKDKNLWVLLQDALEADKTRKAILECQRLSVSRSDSLDVVPFGLFVHIVRHYYPYQYSDLERHRKVAFGSDPLCEIAPPSRSSFVNHTLDRIPNVLKHARCEGLFASGSEEFLSEFEGSLNRALSLQLLLQDNYTNPSWKDVVARCRMVFPECFEEFEAIRKENTAGRHEAARKRSFHLFRSIETSTLDLLAGKEARESVLGPSAA